MVKSFDSRPTEILWRQVWGLAVLLAAIMLSWMAYSFYQPQILQKLKFGELAAWLGIIQGLIATVIEPFVGQFSDRIQQRWGNRLPMISVGVILAGLIFVMISLLVEQNLQGSIRWLVPALMILWAIAIMIFRGPAIALLTQFAPLTELPQANAALVFVFGLIGAIGPFLNKFMHSIGASITFLLGAIALVMGAYILRSLTPPYVLTQYSLNEDLSPNAPSLLLFLIFVIGLGAGLEVNLLMSMFPQVLQTQLPGLRLEFITSGILLVSAMSSVILGELTAQIGVNKVMLLGLGSMTGLMGLALLNDIDNLVVGYILGFGISFGLIFVSMIPFYLGKVSLQQAGLATGLYFGGSAGATAIVAILVKQAFFTSLIAFLLSEVAFFVVAGSLVILKKIQLN
ncbi:MFS transporter [Tolypothrix sp. PCC 7910]|uniref:MFS transporter n=1 Tax=Tolypothrix sp. PCC 7910 TaxID=2099387 RepID=UPI00142790BC|nr:MFS transporter [Tolypothrix sp. PCC 7910]QIR39683.1 MFS transporter [Tolypothrix sp. PCC 7910]